MAEARAIVQRHRDAAERTAADIERWLANDALLPEPPDEARLAWRRSMERELAILREREVGVREGVADA